MKGCEKMNNFDKEFKKAQKTAGALIGLAVVGNIIFWGAILVVGILVLKHFNIL
jgi:hypothetical protein